MADSSNTSTFSNKGYSSAEDDTSGIELKEKNSDILENYDDFRCKCKLLSHIKVRRKSDDFHHFVVFAIAEVSNGIDAVTIGHYTHPAEIGMESWEDIGKFVQHTFLMKENDKHTRTHDILDFERGVYLVKHENYPSTTKAIEEAFNCLSERIGQYDILTDNCEHAISCMLTRDKIRTQKENTKISSPEDQNKLKNYDDFRLKCKPLSHIKVKRDGAFREYYHHFVVLAISKVTDGIDAITIAQYTSSPVIALATCEGIGKFVQETFLMATNDKDTKTNDKDTKTNDKDTETNDKDTKTNDRDTKTNDKDTKTNDRDTRTHAILDFKKGVFLVNPETHPKQTNEIEKAFNRLSERIGERKYDLMSNNCEHVINQILTGKSVSDQIDSETGCNTCFEDSGSHQTDSKAGSYTCFNDLFNIIIIDCKEVGLKTALLVAALGAVAGSLVRRAYVRVIIAAIVSLTVESSIIKCGDKRGSNLRNEASIRIDLAADLPDINDAFKNTSIAILDDMKNHTDTNFVCNIAEKLIYEAAMTTCLVTIAIATGIETILFLSFVFNNLIPRRRKETLTAKDLCRKLFLQLFAGYGSIGIAVVCGYFAFLDFNRPALSFFGIVFGCCIVFRYILTCTAGMIFQSVCFYKCCWDCYDNSSCCKCDEDSGKCYKCYFSTVCFIFLSSVIFLVGACLVVIVFWND